jgi:hypothetical protein
MHGLFDAAWRAAMYCLHPRVIALSVLPLLLMVGAALALGWFYWEPAVDAVRQSFDRWELTAALIGWLEGLGLANLRAVLAPLVIVFLATPVIVVVSLIAVAVLMTPAMVSLVADRRFTSLEKKRGGSFLSGVALALVATAAALVAMVVSIPLWFVPPLVLVIPPLIWGWLTYRVMSYDVLADHASAHERRELMRRHRGALLTMGFVCGYLGAAPSVVWASGVMFVALAPVLVPVAIWIYTLVFAFSALWFAHFALASLQALRRESGADGATRPASEPTVPAVAIASPLGGPPRGLAAPPPEATTGRSSPPAGPASSPPAGLPGPLPPAPHRPPPAT